MDLFNMHLSKKLLFGKIVVENCKLKKYSNTK